jgi:type I restriction enzyme, S subunit
MKTIKSLTEAELTELPKMPEVWSWTKLKMLTDLYSGKAFKKSEYSESGIRLFQIANVSFGYALWDNLSYLPYSYSEEYPELVLHSGDILMALNRPILNDKLKIAILKRDDVPAILYQRVGRFDFYESKIKIYFFYYAQSLFFIDYLKSSMQGVDQPFINKPKLLQIPFPLPPLPEQRAIVSKIELLFSELDNGIANLKLAQEQLKVYRQAVLDKTTKTEMFAPINTIIDELGQGWSPKCHNEPSINSEEWGVIKTTAIQAGYFNEKENKKLPADLEPRVKHELKAGDILITRAGPRVRVGVCCLVKKVRPRLINCDKVYRIRLKECLISPRFFEYTPSSPKYAHMMENLKTGISDSGVNLTQNRFLDLEIPLPPLTEQHAIVQEIETRLSVCDKVEQDIEENLIRAEALRQSILKKAFEGKLLNEKELAEVRRAEDWEPAEVLLERIRAERVGK